MYKNGMKLKLNSVIYNNKKWFAYKKTTLFYKNTYIGGNLITSIELINFSESTIIYIDVDIDKQLIDGISPIKSFGLEKLIELNDKESLIRHINELQETSEFNHIVDKFGLLHVDYGCLINFQISDYLDLENYIINEIIMK